MKPHFLLSVIAVTSIFSFGYSQNANNKLSNLASPTAVNTDLLPGTNNSKNLGNSTFSWKDFYLQGSIYVDGTRFISNYPGTGAYNTFAGSNSGTSITSGTFNTGMGQNSILKNTTGSNNTAFGANSLYSNTSGSFNAAQGRGALYHNITGSNNTAMGNLALTANTSGNSNVAIGSNTLYSNTTGYTNTAIGFQTMYTNTTGYYNTAIGYNALYFNTSGYRNSGLGIGALYDNTTGSFNVAVGEDAIESNSTGDYNTGVGVDALYHNTTGIDNTANGYGALFNNTTASFNTATGVYALENITTGNNNTATGLDALLENTTGSYNTADGTNALDLNTTGINNVASGYSALNSNTIGSNNTANGYDALFNNTSGSFNAATGEYALTSNTTGIGNTAIGHFADVSEGDLNFATAIGNDATVNASSKMQLGSSTAIISTSGGYTIVSDGRFKEQIKDNDVPGLPFINKLRPVTYNFNYKKFDDFLRKDTKNDSAIKNNKEYQSQLVEKAKNRELGFIAQEVDKTVHDNNYTFSGVYTPQNDNDNYALDYGRFVVPLVKAVQELSAKNDSLQNQINELKAMITSSPTSQYTTTISSASLAQNTPNPFTNSTSISYALPQNSSSAKIIVTDKKGAVLKQLNLNGKGNGNVQVDASTLASGAYQYSLYVDGKLIDTKQMMFLK